MPSHDRWGAHARQSRLPPTPPEYQTSYLTPMSAMSDEAHGYYTKRHSYGSRDFQDQYHRAPGYGVQHARGRSKQSSHMQDYAMNYPQPLPMQYQYGNTNLPMLPPIQVPEDLNQYASQYTHAHPEVKAKEEKPTGGVAQHLDYEMDLMAKFVAEMCHQMVTRTTKDPTSHFHKYVSQILSSTRLPSSTIMLGLFYLQERMKIELQLRTDLSSSGALMRMLTTCLLLGSKFLDDNTFQNRSWAEVSNISVHELNSMELEWLKGFNWEIHSMMYDREEGFFMWVDHWHAYEEKAQVQKAKELQKLAPINTNIDRHTAIHQPLLSPDGPIPPQYQQGPQYDTRWARPILEYSPPSAPHSGPTTPEYYNNWHYAPISDSFGVQPWSAQNKSAYHAQRSHLGNYHGQYYNQGYASETNWRGHGAGCGCRGCLHQSEYYMAPAGYPLQPVVG